MIRVIHPHHNANRRWRASVSNLRWKMTHWKRYRVTDAGPNRHHKLSLTDTDCVSVKFGGRNISIATLLFPRRLQLSCTRKLTGNIYPCCSLFLPRHFGFFKAILQLSCTCVKAFPRGGKRYSTKHRAGNFHRWNASRMRRTNTCASPPISANALCEFEPTSVSNMRDLAFAGWLAALQGSILSKMSGNPDGLPRWRIW